MEAERLAAALHVDVSELFQFGYKPAEPAEMRRRLAALVHDMDDKTLAGVYSAVLKVFRP